MNTRTETTVAKKIGTSQNPAIVRVQTEDRARMIMNLCFEHGIEVIVGIEPDKTENIEDVERALHPPTPTRVPSIVGRNEPCPCGSGKKFKKCCAV